MNSKIYYVEECPVCGQGLIRVRVRVNKNRLSACCVCDECDAIWEDPSLEKRVVTTDDQSSNRSPSGGIWDKGSHWATISEICLLGWFAQMKSVESPGD